MDSLLIRNLILPWGILFLFSCSNIQAPEFETITDFTAMGNGDTIVLTGNGIFYNPNKSKLTLKNVDISVFLNEQQITRIKEKFNYEIPPEQEFIIPLRITLNEQQVKSLITNNALSLLAGRGINLNYKGRIRIKTLSLPVSVPIDEEISINLNDLL